jgi:uncharacterized protein involved in exopolysaccharide biosynthesis
MSAPHPVYGEIEVESAGSNLFDWQRVREHLRFVLGSLRRHALLFALVAVVIVGGGLTAAFTLPRTYRVEAKILAQRNMALAVRGDGPSGDAPTRAAAEVILRRDNLVALIGRTDLVRHWHDHRAPAQRAYDAVVSWARGPESDEDALEDTIERLNKHLAVWTNDERTVAIAVDWPDPQMAQRIVADAQDSFLSAKRAQEVSALAESIAILQRHAVDLRADVDDALAAVKQLRPDAPSAAASTSGRRALVPTTVPVAVRSPAPAASDPDLAELRSEIDAKQRAIDELESFRGRRLSELQGQLAELRANYTEKHPAVAEAQQAIGLLSKESPPVTALREQLAERRAEYERLASPPSTPGPPPATHVVMMAPAPARSDALPPLPVAVSRLDDELRDERDPATIYARGRLRDAMEKYSALRTQIETAQIDLDTSDAAFKYRYSIVTPPQPPRHPTSPNVPLLLVATLLGALAAATLACVVSDVRAGRLVESWQLERVLGAPLLGDVSLGDAKEPGPP